MFSTQIDFLLSAISYWYPVIEDFKAQKLKNPGLLLLISLHAGTPVSNTLLSLSNAYRVLSLLICNHHLLFFPEKSTLSGSHPFFSFTRDHSPRCFFIAKSIISMLLMEAEGKTSNPNLFLFTVVKTQKAFGCEIKVSISDSYHWIIATYSQKCKNWICFQLSFCGSGCFSFSARTTGRSFSKISENFSPSFWNSLNSKPEFGKILPAF